MKISETRITVAGVMRCCLESVPMQMGEPIEVGDELSCEYCETAFRLKEDKMWTPLWQIEESG